MDKVRFGKTNFMVSRVAFGGIPIMRLGMDDAVKVVRDVIGMGVNFLDTAHVYVDSEEKIGKAIKGINRDSLIIASKSGSFDKNGFNADLDQCLKRLGADHVDLYQHHNIASKEIKDKVFGPGGAYEAMESAIKAGKVRFAAFSSHNSEVACQVMKTGHFASVQLPFNFLETSPEKEAIHLAKQLDMGFIAMKPMGGGMFDDAGLAFRYLLQFDNVIPDPGIEKSEEMRQIVGIVEANKALDDADKAKIAKIRAEIGSEWCHRCNYCQPCPQGIDISACLMAKSSCKRFTPDRARSMVGDNIEKARTCLECGECMTRCPYGLKIPELLKKNIAWWDENFKNK
ncbi:aldo/keto reductase [Spirochaetia bacterium]|nr:aldo/keto reductase [Spirochaetia bacterium]GHV21107.1 aldo/keto reductase [Spirochaetia bacterium]